MDCALCGGMLFEADELAWCTRGCTSHPWCLDCLGSHTPPRCLEPGCDGTMVAWDTIQGSITWDFCPVCSTAYWAGDYDAMAIFRCPSECRGVILCKSCFHDYDGQEFRCPRCAMILSDRSGALAQTERDAGAGTMRVGWASAPPSGQAQRGNQCYAAAVATACNWVNATELTTDEAMHLYLVSEKATCEVAPVYREAYDATKSRLGAGAGVRDVQRGMADAVLHEARQAFGVPEFPLDVPHVYVPRITTETLTTAFGQNLPVMWAMGTHWQVAYGAEVSSDGFVLALHSFDVTYGTEGRTPWSPSDEGRYEGYVVGRSGS